MQSRACSRGVFADHTVEPSQQATCAILASAVGTLGCDLKYFRCYAISQPRNHDPGDD